MAEKWKENNGLSLFKNQYWTEGSKRPRLNAQIWITLPTLEALIAEARASGDGASLTGPVWRKEGGGDRSPVFSGPLKTKAEADREREEYKARQSGGQPAQQSSQGGLGFEDEEVPF